jgi:hypothetical protein
MEKICKKIAQKNFSKTNFKKKFQKKISENFPLIFFFNFFLAIGGSQTIWGMPAKNFGGGLK